MIYRLVWQATMVAHFLVIAYIALGGFLAWWRPRLIWPHLALCAWGLVQLTGLVIRTRRRRTRPPRTTGTSAAPRAEASR